MAPRSTTTEQPDQRVGASTSTQPHAVAAATAVMPSSSPTAEATTTASSSVGPAPGSVPAGASTVSASSVVFGVSDPNLTTQAPTIQLEQLRAMRAIGVTSVRLEANWYWGQPTASGGFKWGVMDQAIASIQKAGLSADLLIDGCPPWAAISGTQGTQYAQPASSTQFAAWAGAVAARYGPKGIRYFEIWNEPNLAVFWQPKPEPAAYTADLKAAYSAIKGADPSAVVLSGGLAPADNDGTNYDPRTFLQDMYADGANGSFDELGYHPYSYPASPNSVESWSGWSMMSDTSPSIRSIMAENGDSAKKIWITEYGAPTSGPNSVGEVGQSTDLVQAISQVRKLDWIGSFYIYTWADISSLPSDQNGFGLLTDTDTRKPAYSAVAAALANG